LAFSVDLLKETSAKTNEKESDIRNAKVRAEENNSDFSIIWARE